MSDISLRSSDSAIIEGQQGWETARRLYFKGNRLVIPFSERLRTKIVQDHHDDQVSGHAGRNELYEKSKQVVLLAEYDGHNQSLYV